MRDVVKKAGGKKSTHGVVAAREFLKKKGVPSTITKDLGPLALAGSVKVGTLVLYALSFIPKANRTFPLALKNGFLVIGGCVNGDPVALELKTRKMAFLSHDILLEFDPEEFAFEECVARSKLTLEQFWRKASSPGFPVDFYDAKGD